MKKFEYKTIEGAFESEIIRMGNYGWELCAISDIINYPFKKLYFKKEFTENDSLLISAFKLWVFSIPEEKRDKPYISKGDKEYSPNDLLREIINETEFGVEFIKTIINSIMFNMFNSK